MTDILLGKNAIVECIKAGQRQVYTVYLQGKRDKGLDKKLIHFISQHKIACQIVSAKELDRMSDGAAHRGMMAEVDAFRYSSLEASLATCGESALYVVCDSITDPQNFGAICRSALCFGATGVIVAKDNSAPIRSAVVQASAGAVEHLQVVEVTNLARALGELKKAGFWVYGADAKASQSLTQFKPSPKMALVMGSEGSGIRPLVQKNCDESYFVPMKGSFDSLNVAQATSIFLYEMTKNPA